MLNFSSRTFGAKAASPAMMIVSAAPPKFRTTYMGFLACISVKKNLKTKLNLLTFIIYICQKSGK